MAPLLLQLILGGTAFPLLAAAPSTPWQREKPTEPGPINELRAWIDQEPSTRPELTTRPFAAAALTKAQAATARQLLIADYARRIRSARDKEWSDQAITIGDHTLKWKQKHFGRKPADGWNLFISLHGGGNAPAAVNGQQWENQIRLYQPADSLYLAPRAPTNTWNLWHEPHMDLLLARLLQDAFVMGEVNPNRVYIMGYSAGGDGVYQLAPRMADRWAAAAMMAGHPNDASPLGLRNIGFTIHVGALDGGYGRNKVAAEWGKKLDDLERADPKGYPHLVQLHAGRGHWMNLEDRVAIDWMAKFTRNPTPEKIVWNQSGVTHDAFYWLAVPAAQPKTGQLVVASRKGQEIAIEKSQGVSKLIVLLNDSMLDLERPVSITCGPKTLFQGIVSRTIGRLYSSLNQRGDPLLMFDGQSAVDLEKPQ